MNNSQKLSLIIGIMAIFAMILVPPWKPTGEYALIFDPPDPLAVMDYARLGVQCILATLFSVALYLVSTPNTQSQPSPALQAPQSEPTPSPLATPQVPPTEPDNSNHMIKLVVAGFLLTFVAVVAWHLYDQHQKAMFAREIIESAQQERQRETEAAEREQERMNILAVKQQQYAQEAADMAAQQQAQQEASAAAQLRALASPRTWPAMPVDVENVHGSLETMWRDDNLYYRLRLSGPPERVEEATARSKNYSVTLLSSVGMPAFDFTISGGQLHLAVNHQNGRSVFASDESATACPLETYRDLRSWRLSPSN